MIKHQRAVDQGSRQFSRPDNRRPDQKPLPNYQTLTYALATALDQEKKHNGEANTSGDANHINIVHIISPFPALTAMPAYSKYLSNDSSNLIIEGPKTTKNKEGNIKKTSGNTSFTVVFAACSSASWRRWVRSTSE